MLTTNSRWNPTKPQKILPFLLGANANLYGYVVNDPINTIDPTNLAKLRFLRHQSICQSICGASKPHAGSTALKVSNIKLKVRRPTRLS